MKERTKKKAGRPPKKPEHVEELSIPVVDPLQQALAAHGCGMYRNKTLRQVVKTDLAWLHWLYRKMRSEGDFDAGGKPSTLALQLRLLAFTFPLGVNDEAERELKAGMPIELKEERPELPKILRDMDAGELEALAHQLENHILPLAPEPMAWAVFCPPNSGEYGYLVFPSENQARDQADLYAQEYEEVADQFTQGAIPLYPSAQKKNDPPPVPNLVVTGVKPFHGAFADGYTQEDVDVILNDLSEVLSLQLIICWEKYEDGMCCGDSELYVIDLPSGHLFEAPSAVKSFLNGDETTTTLKPTDLIIGHFVAKDTAYTQIDECNFVWKKGKKKTNGRTKNQGSNREDTARADVRRRQDGAICTTTAQPDGDASGNDNGAETKTVRAPGTGDKEQSPVVDVPDDSADGGSGKTQ